VKSEKQTQFKAKQSQFKKSPNECKLNFNKGLQKKRLFSSPKNKPNSNPILSAVGGLQMSLKSLAGKSGHTHTHRDLIVPFTRNHLFGIM